jgi:hypothetical protein
MGNKHEEKPDFTKLEQGKDIKKKRLIQLQVVKKAFEKGSFTMLEIDRITGIERANICRYVKILKSSKEIVKVKQVRCPITRHWAFQYTTDKKLFPRHPKQGNLFENEIRTK